MFSPKFKANHPKPDKAASQNLPKEKSPPLKIVWAPEGASTNPDQKRFRPINFSSPSLSRKNFDSKNFISPPWSEDGDNDLESFFPNEKTGYMSEPDQRTKTEHVDRSLNRIQLHEISRSKPYHKICPTIFKTSHNKKEHDTSHCLVMRPESRKGREHQKLANRNAEGNLSRALLKEQGYDSDSTIVFHKKAESEIALLSPVEQKLAYRRMQAGGEPPLQGFRKIVFNETNKDIASALHMEIVGSRKNHKTRPFSMLGTVHHKAKTWSYVPQPPHRKSSKCILKFDSLPPGLQTWRNKPSNNAYNRYSTSLEAQQMRSHLLSDEEEKYSIKKMEVNNWCNRRAASSSPVRRPTKSATDDTRVAFGRKISREFTFAEEKKRLEEEFSKIYKDVTVSTRILRNPDLKSNQQVKFALQNSLEPLTKTLICTRRSRNQSTAKLNGSHTSISSFYANKSIRQSDVKMKKTYSQSFSNSTLSLDLLDSNAKIKRKTPSNKAEKTKIEEKNKTNKKKEKNLAQCSNEIFFEKSTEQLNSAIIKPVNIGNNNDKFTKYEQINFGNFNSNDYSNPASYTFNATNNSRRQSRSPSIRRIQSIKQQLIIAHSKQKNLRSRSLSNSGFYCIQSQSSRMDRSFSLNSVSQIPENFRINNFERFQELTKFYSSLERIGQLEKTISQTDLRRKNNNEIRDFSLRQSERTYDNAKQELEYLMKNLRDQQDKKNVFFQAQDPDKIRWNEENDAGLRVRDKSVDDLKQIFTKKPNYHMTFHRIDIKSSLGRENSVIEKANKMAKKYGITNEENHLVNHGLSPKLLSTLSYTQKAKLIDQLNEIYTNYDKKRSPNTENINFNTFPMKKRSSSEPPILASTMNNSQTAEKKIEKSCYATTANKYMKTNLNTSTEEDVKHNKKLVNEELKNIRFANQNHIKNKINYFEHIHCSKYIPTTIYHAREYSSGEEDVLSSQCKPCDIDGYLAKPILSSSQSFSDLGEIFGESKQYSPSFYCSEIKNHKNTKNIHFNQISPNDSDVFSNNCENSKSQLASPRTDIHLRRFQSDSELDNLFFSASKSGQFTESIKPNKIEPKGGNNIKSSHATSPISRSPLRKTSIYMPHINVISKTASLKKEIGGNVKAAKHETVLGESIKKIKDKLELQGFNVCGQMFSSAPDIREYKDISSYLSGHWIAHQYPKPEDNGKVTNEINTPKYQSVNSDRDSGPLSNQTSYKSQSCDWFSCNADVHEIDSINNLNDKFFHLKLEKSLKNLSASDQTAIRFRDNTKDTQKINFDEQINIHYKTPIRLERKELISEDELMNKQADHMKKVYQDEKKRKYIQEIQNLDNRRHTDNFTPSQKSPISLNRYDDFPVEYTSKSRNPTKIVSRALYNFTGQSPRELTFKKSDLIYIRRKVDQNWYEGELHANLGLVPINYVEILSKNITVPYKMQPQSLIGKARAKFTFIAQSPLELPLKKGELVTITKKIDDNWYEGKIGEQKGIFPVAYVELLGMDDHFPTKKSNALITCQQSFFIDEFLEPQKMLKERKNIKKTEILHIDTDNEPIVYKAMFSYKPQNCDELELVEGDTIYVLEKCDDGWYVGTSERTNLFGTFPGNYVKRT